MAFSPLPPFTSELLAVEATATVSTVATDYGPSVQPSGPLIPTATALREPAANSDSGKQ